MPRPLAASLAAAAVVAAVQVVAVPTALPTLDVEGLVGQVPAVAMAPSQNEPVLYNCLAEYEYWEVAWTPDWKAWCCKHERRGCPSTTTLTTTTRTRTSTTRTSTTRTSTTLTSTATSTTRTRTSTRTVTLTKAVVAHQNHTTTPQNQAAAKRTGLPADVGAPGAAAAASCETVCEFEGANVTCRDRIQWAKENYYDLSSHPCEDAQALVLSQCATCGQCVSEGSGCGRAAAGGLPLAQVPDLHFGLQKFEGGAAVPLPRHSGAQPRPRPAAVLATVLMTAGLLAAAAVKMRARGRRLEEERWADTQADEDGAREMLLAA